MTNKTSAATVKLFEAYGKRETKLKYDDHGYDAMEELIDSVGYAAAGWMLKAVTNKHHVTFFPTYGAQSKTEDKMTLVELRDKILKTKKPTKDELPWLKLAVFGNKRTDKNALRSNANYAAIGGVELDYDEKQVSFESAIKTVTEAKLMALLYTTAHYKPAEPKWRILLPLSRLIAPERGKMTDHEWSDLMTAERAKLVARVNGLFGGIFDDNASFTLSQAFYFGGVGENPSHRAEIVYGDYIDQRPDLDTGAIYKKGEKQSGAKKTQVENWEVHVGLEERKHARDDIAEMFDNIRDGVELHASIRDIAIHHIQAGMHAGAVVKLLRGMMHKSAAARDERWKERYDDIPRAVKSAEEKTETEAEEEKISDEITAEPHDFPDEASLPRWDFIYGYHLLRGEVAGTAAAGGIGKTTMSIGEALAMAAGRDLLGQKVPYELRVLIINLEDNRATMNKRIAAAMRHHGLTKKDIGGRLFLKAKGELKFVADSRKFVAALIKFIKDNKIDVVSVDPFVRTHKVNENDNVAIAKVIEIYEAIATECNCAISLWHHTRKVTGAADISMDAARGASSFVDACRSVRVIENITKKEAEDWDIENRRAFFKAFSGKLNYAPTLENCDVYQIKNVPLMKGTLGLMPDGGNGGDNVGVVEAWKDQVSLVKTIEEEQIAKIHVELASGIWREDVRADMWVGKAIGPILGIDPGKNSGKLKDIVRDMLFKKTLKRFGGKRYGNKNCVFVVPPDWFPEAKK